MMIMINNKHYFFTQDWQLLFGGKSSFKNCILYTLVIFVVLKYRNQEGGRYIFHSSVYHQFKVLEGYEIKYSA